MSERASEAYALERRVTPAVLLSSARQPHVPLSTHVDFPQDSNETNNLVTQHDGIRDADTQVLQSACAHANTRQTQKEKEKQERSGMTI